jgi:hypothetical protein
MIVNASRAIRKSTGNVFQMSRKPASRVLTWSAVSAGLAKAQPRHQPRRPSSLLPKRPPNHQPRHQSNRLPRRPSTPAPATSSVPTTRFVSPVRLATLASMTASATLVTANCTANASQPAPTLSAPSTRFPLRVRHASLASAIASASLAISRPQLPASSSIKFESIGK